MAPLDLATEGYRVEDEAGRGGMGVVFRAEQLRLSRKVAIKALKKHRAEKPTARAAFLGEALIGAYLDHPNIVPIHDLVDTRDGGLAISMKLIGGRSWLQELQFDANRSEERGEPFPIDKHLEVLGTAANAVAYAHSKGIIHRDLKPSNVMLGDFGEIYVMDWGMAIVWSGALANAQDLEPIQRLNLPVRPCGTPGYMAPEQVQVKTDLLGPWTDIYLLGSILFEIIEKRPPHQGGRISEVLSSAYRSLPPVFGDDTPEELRQICARAMARKIKDRYSSVAEFQQAIAQFRKHRDSRVITQRAEATMESVAEMAQIAPAAGRRGTLRRQDAAPRYAALSEAIYGFQQALNLWPENPEAASLLTSAREHFAELALEFGDLSLAKSEIAHLKTPKARELSLAVVAAESAKAKQEKSTLLLKRSLAVLGLALLVSLVAGIIMISGERNRADVQARLAEDSARAARASAAEAEVNARVARENEAKATKAAEEQERLSRQKLEAVEEKLREARRADDATKKAQEKELEAHRASKLAARSDERAGAAERLVETETDRAREAALEHDQELLSIGFERDRVRLSSLELMTALMNARAEIPAGTHEESSRLVHDLESEGARYLSEWVDAARPRFEAMKSGTLRGFDDFALRVGRFQREFALLKDAHGGLLPEESAAPARALFRELALETEKLQRELPAGPGAGAICDRLRMHAEFLARLSNGLGRFEEARAKRPSSSGAREVGTSPKSNPARGTKTPTPPAESPKSPSRDGRFGAVPVEPVPQGLKSLGRDPISGLPEFLHVASHDGEFPGRDTNGALKLDDSTGVIFVRVPVDHQGRETANAGSMTLISKFEMTQAQWLKLFGVNPSRHGPNSKFGGRQHTLRHPIESITYEDLQALSRFGLSIPTEAQWEAIALVKDASEDSVALPSPDGNPGANLADRQFRRYFKDRPFEDIDDGYMMHAPAGAFAQNAWGLFDLQGNVAEYCVADRAEKSEGGASGDALQDAVLKGGSFLGLASEADPRDRKPVERGIKSPGAGVRPIFKLP